MAKLKSRNFLSFRTLWDVFLAFFGWVYCWWPGHRWRVCTWMIILAAYALRNCISRNRDKSLFIGCPDNLFRKFIEFSHYSSHSSTMNPPFFPLSFCVSLLGNIISSRRCCFSCRLRYFKHLQQFLSGSLSRTSFLSKGISLWDSLLFTICASFYALLAIF